MPGNPYQRAAELEVLESAVRQLGWPAVDGNAPGHRSFGWDVQLLRPDGSMFARIHPLLGALFLLVLWRAASAGRLRPLPGALFVLVPLRTQLRRRPGKGSHGA